ncbi:translin-associated protein X-like [Watersipora subatra]|uniref:translin-associated protein X-like n=1 Tax=Watersipora subatra TaxID=2589382 RepID=UPI00355C1BD6
MGGGKGGNRRGHGRKSGPKSSESSTTFADSPVIQAFLGYKTLLDEKHDKHEALVKISRDTTIDSKRIIFHLHRCIGGDKEQLLAETELMIDKCIRVNLAKMAVELKSVDQYKYSRAITAGIQEFIEAYTFYTYVKGQSLPTIEEVQSKLQFIAPSLQPEASLNEKRSAQAPTEAPCPDLSSHVMNGSSESAGFVRLSQMDFVLGIADLTGELMRMSINSIGWGDVDLPVELCSVLQLLEQAFLTHCSTARGEMARKIQTLKQSVFKVENACYTVKIRGSEVPKHMLAHSVQTNEKHLAGDGSQTSADWS